MQVHHRDDPAKPFSTDYVSFAGRVGNNAQYALDLRAFDPFAWGKCLNGVPTTETTEPDGSRHLQSTTELYFTVNGSERRPSGGGTFRVVYDDAADAPRVTCE